MLRKGEGTLSWQAAVEHNCRPDALSTTISTWPSTFFSSKLLYPVGSLNSQYRLTAALATWDLRHRGEEIAPQPDQTYVVLDRSTLHLSPIAPLEG